MLEDLPPDDIEDSAEESIFEEDKEHRDRRNRAAYVAAYQSPAVLAWWQSLSPEIQREARKLGLDRPALPATSGAVEDLGASKTEAVDYDDDGEEIEGGGDELADGTTHDGEEESKLNALRARFAEGIRGVVIHLLEQRNARLALEVFALATGVGYEGLSEAAIARKHGLTRAAVSKRCIAVCETLGIQPSRAMMKRFESNAAA